MLNQPLKLMLVVGAVAFLGASLLSQKFDTSGLAPSAPARAANGGTKLAKPADPVSRSWYSGWFEGMSFRSSPKPARAPISPNPPKVSSTTGFGSVMIAADQGGQFNTSVEIGGQLVPMLVDTGATVIALSAKDAQLLGISPLPSDFTVKISTANGVIKAARTTLSEVRLENITVRDVQAVVMPEGALQKSLLGMSFLRKLKRFEVASGKLILRP